MHFSTYSLNTYFAMLVVTVIASGAALLIVHVGTSDVTATALGNEAPYADLQRSILGE